MIEGEIAPIDEELQSLAHLVTRQHAIVLCCAHSVAELVEEVARNLGGLGFDVDVVCGAEARSALLGRYERRDEPTIYVVCVQGTLKEQVLKPLRQALATHGGPNQHLFVAVLDLALPLAMVGQIRRFAEALERPAGRGHGGLNERRQWRENLGPGGAERMPTRAYRAVDVLERSGSHPVVGATVAPRTGPQAVIGSARPAKLGATAKYREVTGQLPALSEENDPSPETSSSRRRRKTHAPKVRVKPIAPARGRRAGARDVMKEDTGAGDAAAEREAEAIVAALERAASAELDASAGDDEGLREHVPPAVIDATMAASWGLDDQPTAVRPRQSDAAIAAARSGDTVVAPPPLPGSTRRETVLYTETADDAVLLAPEPEGTEPDSASARGNTVIGQPPTRFRATPVSMPAQRGDTAVGTVVPPPGSRGETVVATPRSDASSTARGDTVVAPPRGEASPTVRGDTVVARVTLVPSSTPARSSEASATARGNTVIPSSSEVSASPTARGETVLAPPPSEASTPTVRGETVLAPPPSEASTPTARGMTVVPDDTARSDASPTARGETVLAPPRSDGSTARGMTVVPDDTAASSASPTARGATVVPGDDASATARGETVLLDAAPSRDSPTARGETVLLDATPSLDSPTTRGETELLGAALPRESPTGRGETELLTAVARDLPDAAARPSRVREARPVASIVAPEAALAADPIFEPRRRSRWPLALAATAIAGAIVLIWSTGALEGLRGAPTAAPVAGSTALPEPTIATREPADPAAHAAVDPGRARADARTPAELPEPTAAEPTTAPPIEPAPSEPAAKPEPATAEPPTPEPTAAETPTPVPLPAEAQPDPIAVPREGRIDPALATAISQRRIRLTEDLYVTSLRNDATTWSAARALCEALELDGVRGFRLPFRRELQAIDVAGYLRVAPHWSRTVPDDDHDAAYVLHPSTGQLTVWYKQESAAVVCVRSR